MYRVSLLFTLLFKEKGNRSHHDASSQKAFWDPHTPPPRSQEISTIACVLSDTHKQHNMPFYLLKVL